MITMYAKHIINLLEAKHSKDVFIPECKDGPTQSVTEHLRMDAWVMNRSWVHPCYTAYEVKVSRSDFLNDRKWRGYLPYCNEFFFVAPKGIIDPSELPPEAGLLVLLGGAEGKRLVCKKKAAWRDVDVPESLFRYVLMCRVQVGRDDFSREPTKEERVERWKDFVVEKVETRKLGYRVGEAIREKVAHVHAENDLLSRRMDDYDSIKQFLERIGVEPEGYVAEWNVKRHMEEYERVFDPTLIIEMQQLHNCLSAALKTVERLESERKTVEAVA